MALIEIIANDRLGKKGTERSEMRSRSLVLTVYIISRSPSQVQPRRHRWGSKEAHWCSDGNQSFKDSTKEVVWLLILAVLG